jgi:RND family efflux transporter MFP subunit
MHRSFVFATALAFIVNGCSSRPDSDRQQKRPAESATIATPPGSIRLTPEQIEVNGIQVSDVVEDSVSPMITTVGHVRARAGGEAEVFPPFAGRLLSELALPKPGDSISKGQLIADVEQRFVASEKFQFAAASIQLQSEIEQAQHEVDLKNADKTRSQQLYEGGAIPLKQLQGAEFDLKQAQTKLEAAKHSKQQYDAAQSETNEVPRREAIIAPISGTVLSVDATLGQQVDPAKRILAIADLGTVWVEAAVHERDLPQTRGAKQAEMTIPFSTQKPVAGSLVTTGNVVDPQTRTVPMIFAVSNPNAVLKLEMFVDVHIPVGPRLRALVIPSSAIISGETSSSVYVEVQPGVYQPRTIELGQRAGDKVVALSGLARGDKVVTVGAQSLRGESRKGEIPVDEDDKDKDKKEK